MIHIISFRLFNLKIGQIKIKEANSIENCGRFAHYGESLHRHIWWRISSTTSKEKNREPLFWIKFTSFKNKLSSSKFSSAWYIQIWWEAYLKALSKWLGLLYKLIIKFTFFRAAYYIPDAMLSAINNTTQGLKPLVPLACQFSWFSLMVCEWEMFTVLCTLKPIKIAEEIKEDPNK